MRQRLASHPRLAARTLLGLALVLGIAESVIPYLLRDIFGWEAAFAWKDAIAFALLIVILVVKPTGLLGKPIREKV